MEKKKPSLKQLEQILDGESIPTKIMPNGEIKMDFEKCAFREECYTRPALPVATEEKTDAKMMYQHLRKFNKWFEKYCKESGSQDKLSQDFIIHLAIKHHSREAWLYSYHALTTTIAALRRRVKELEEGIKGTILICELATGKNITVKGIKQNLELTLKASPPQKEAEQCPESIEEKE